MRTFAVDVLACPKCHGRMRLLAMVEEPANVARFLPAMGKATEVPPPLTGARSPEEGTLPAGCEEALEGHRAHQAKSA